jgi:hypothetical protein
MINKNASVQTRRIYAMEKELERQQVGLPIWYLRSVGERLWPANKKKVKIVAGRGMQYNGRLLSYYDGDQIVLARNGRKVSVLLHEIAHVDAGIAAGHGAKFVASYFDLLVTFGLIDRSALCALADKYKVL